MTTKKPTTPVFTERFADILEIVARIKASCEEGQRGLQSLNGTLPKEDEDKQAWEPDLEGFDAMIDDLNTIEILVTLAATDHVDINKQGKRE